MLVADLRLMKRYFAATIIKADLELVKDAGAAKEVEADAEAFRKADRSCDFPLVNLDNEIMKIGRDKTSITDDNHLWFAPIPFYSDAVRIIHAQDSECCSGINKDPCSCGTEW